MSETPPSEQWIVLYEKRGDILPKVYTTVYTIEDARRQIGRCQTRHRDAVRVDAARSKDYPPPD